MNLIYNSRVGRAAISLLFLILLFSLAPAQKSAKPALSYKLLSIHIKGASQLHDDELIAASGLKLGQFAGEKEFQQASKQLGDTGLFTNLAYSYHYSSAGCDVEFQVSENAEMVDRKSVV